MRDHEKIVRRSGGAVYDPALDVWRPMAFDGSPPINSPAAAVWTGSELPQRSSRDA
jgi:hypothetical protein